NVPQWQEGTLGGLNVSVPTPEAYPLWAGGVQVHELNASNITGEGITGSVSYNDDDKTLTLDGAKITSSKKTINFNGINLIIDLKNENKVIYTGSNDIAIGADAVGNNLTLQGKGKLDVSSASSLPAISASKLLFNGGNVKVLNTNSFALGATVGGTIAGIELNNCKIETPVNGTIGKHPTKTNIWTILTSDNQPAQTVEIVRTGTGLSTLAAEGIYVWGEKGVISIETSGSASGRTAQIYNVSGILVRTLPLQGTEGQVAVPAGIYIVKIGNAIEKVVVR
ncbi:MAG TPA: DUF6383 domain-containing protein, partial [Paludibacteraceae bacterium]|nr:DUF6383 domain-containing protein [Paludibacteraceae bacterium]